MNARFRPFLLICAALVPAGVFGAAGCELIEPHGTIARFADDGTVFIAGVIEATPDTAAFYAPPEVFVGTLEDQHNTQWSLLSDPAVTADEHVWNPTLYGQVVMLLDRLKQRPVGDEAAEVIVTGPLGGAAERPVRLAHKGGGVYADLAGALAVEAGARYRLDVALSDGRSYTSTGLVPSLPRWSPPDTVAVPVELGRYERSGRAYEEGRVSLPMWEHDDSNPFVVEQSNGDEEFDRWVFQVGPQDELLHSNQGDYRREGLFYGVADTAVDVPKPLPVIWSGDCGRESYALQPRYLRLSIVGPELASFYFQELAEFAFDPGSPFVLHVRRVWGSEGRGRGLYDYLHGRANIERVGPDGEALPHEDSDALGVFGGYASVYRKTVLLPERDFDIDAVPDWPCTD